jgi:3-oxoacyl-[acyl-carrier protein] reductase
MGSRANDVKRALVTGGASGIGREVAVQLARSGFKLVIADRNVDGMDQVQHQIRAGGGSCDTVEVDLAQADSVHRLFRTPAVHEQALDVLVCTAGISKRQPLLETTQTVWRDILEVNLTATFNTMQEAARLMTHGAGRIVTISSHSAALGSVGRGAYAASKGGLTAMTRVMAVEIARLGITVNCVAPGPIATPMTAGHTEHQKQAWLDRLPIKRYGTPAEVASAVIYLCSADAAYITGQTIYVDGGFSAAGIMND